MRQSSASELFLNGSFPSIEAHHYQPFRNGHLDVRLPTPNSDIRLFIFNPVDYPYLWMKYLEGLQREYTRMGVSHILDMEALSKPESSQLALLGIVNGEVLAGLRFHGPLRDAKDASVLKEMDGGNTTLLQKHIEHWLSEKVVEPKGLWVYTKNSIRKRLVKLMARCVVYGTLLLESRYAICTSPRGMNKIYIEAGMINLDEIGHVTYPNEDYISIFGHSDINNIFNSCDGQNKVLISREWGLIHQVRLSTQPGKRPQNTWRPLILDNTNPFHEEVIESVLFDDSIEKMPLNGFLPDEINKLIPCLDDDLKNEGQRKIVYPWRGSSIELCGPRSFKRLIYDRNRNKITEDEQNQLSGLSIGVVGLSTGNIIAQTLVMEGLCGYLKLADFDDIEISNLNRIPASLLDVGVNKAVVVARRVAEINPYLPLDIYDEGISKSNIEHFMDGLDIVIEECDSLDVKLLIREAAAKLRIPVLMATSDIGMMDIERFDQDEALEPFYGLIDVNTEELENLSRRDKAGYVLGLIEGGKISARLGASMAEIDYSIKTWPQLASDVAQGAATVASAVRLIGMGKTVPTGRTRIDMDAILKQGEPPVPSFTHISKPDKTPQFTGEPKADMLLAAQFAPSPGNIQPWEIYWKEGRLAFEVDRSLTTSMDVKSRGALTAVGAACMNAEVVAAHYGLPGQLEYFPFLNEQPDLAAMFTPSGQVNQEISQFFPYLLTRVTNRKLGKSNPIPTTTMNKLNEVTRLYPTSLYVLDQPGDLDAYADISVESDRFRYLCRHLHQEMMGELVWPGKAPLDQGIDVRTLELEHKDLNALSVLQRGDVMEKLAEWDVGQSLGNYNRDRIVSASAIVVMTIEGQSELDYLLGGKALQHFWLLAEQSGLAVQPISPIFLYGNNQEDIQQLMHGNYLSETEKLRKQFYKLLHISDDEYPLLVMRLAYANKPKYRSLRRGFVG